MEQLFDDLEDFGSFDDAISGDVRDPYTELARLRREEPVQRLETSGVPCGRLPLHRLCQEANDAARQRDVPPSAVHRGVRSRVG
jgi:hypothetical protein